MRYKLEFTSEELDLIKRRLLILQKANERYFKGKKITASQKRLYFQSIEKVLNKIEENSSTMLLSFKEKASINCTLTQIEGKKVENPALSKIINNKLMNIK